MEHSSLQELLCFLEYGTRLHITVAFLENYGNKKTMLDKYFINHSKPYCDFFKSTPGGLLKCISCRNKAFNKAISERVPFGGLCSGGIYEYVSPVIYDGAVIAVLFVGNISDREIHGFSFEKNFDEEKCRRLCTIIENHIKLLVKEYSNDIHSYSPLIVNIKNYIEESLFGEISVSEIARIFNYNEKYIGKLFKEEEGVGMLEYINTKRLDKSCELLKLSSKTVIEVARQTGFNNVTYFNRLFKKRFGKTPTEYRNKKEK